jgi:hypothetical protein
MSATKLLRHGENIKPEYLAKPGKTGPAGKSTNASRPDGQVSGTVKRYRKKIKPLTWLRRLASSKRPILMPLNTLEFLPICVDS